MADRLNDTRAEAYSQFKKWLGIQPYWLQDAAYRIYHSLPIDDKQIQTYVDMCVAEIKKEKPTFKHLDERDVEAGDSSKNMTVLNLTDIVGVNALATDARLDFSPKGVTIVYGLNGAGKSGFMRIFKQLSGNPYEEPIQPNVFRRSETVRPSCSFRICINETEQRTTCDLSIKANNPLLAECDVFDTRISNAYINNPNNPSYQPFVFTVLTELSRIADLISNRIREMIKSIKPISIAFPDQLSFQDDLKWVQDLNEKTVVPACYSTWTDEQEKRLAEIPALLDTDSVTQRLKLLRTQLQSLTPILADLSAAREVLVSGNIETAHEEYKAAKKRLEAAEKLFADSADDLDKISVSSQDWKILWSVAKRYYETIVYKSVCKHFAEEGSICPLCHQEITDASYTRYQNVNEYINGSCSEDYKKALTTLRNIITTLTNREYNHGQIKQIASGILSDDEIEEIANVYKEFSAANVGPDIEKTCCSLYKVNTEKPAVILTEKVKILKEEIEKLDAALKSEKRIELTNELKHLQCHKWVYLSLETINSAINDIKRKKELADAMTLSLTNKITIEANKLAEALITDAYMERFASELRKLAPSIKVKLEKAASRKGNSPYKVMLDSVVKADCKTEDVLSEGEQRIVALAAFFADATGRNGCTPIVIDDPISSLDYNFEETATNRIVELAHERQVIVFTHRISLLVGIKDLCESEGIVCEERRIRSATKGKGVPDFEGNYYGKIPGQLNETVGRIAQIKKMDPDSLEYQDAVGRICQQFRICVERTVEDELLFGMVKRFSRRIKTDGLIQKLPVITKDDCAMIDSMMTKYSFMEHSQPAETPLQYYDIDEIQNDVQTFANWLAEYKNRAKKL